MSTLVEKLIDAQKRAMAIRPKVGGFPLLAEVLRQSGVLLNRWSLPACQSIFVMKEGSVVHQGTPLVNGIHPIPKFDRESLIAAIRADQAGKTSFPDFLTAVWQAGVTSYDADFIGRKVTYFGAQGESYLEEYLAVEVQELE